uniref:Uncharacterized protein n=1 Tax=Sus scrofa TaxID=9823 RepID=A0A5G2RAK2_PIG
MEFLQKETHCGCALGSALAVPSLWSEALEPEATQHRPLWAWQEWQRAEFSLAHLSYSPTPTPCPVPL